MLALVLVSRGDLVCVGVSSVTGTNTRVTLVVRGAQAFTNVVVRDVGGSFFPHPRRIRVSGPTRTLTLSLNGDPGCRAPKSLEVEASLKGKSMKGACRIEEK